MLKYWNEIFKSKNLTKRLFYIKYLISSGYSKYTNLVDVTLGNNFSKSFWQFSLEQEQSWNHFNLLQKWNQIFFAFKTFIRFKRDNNAFFVPKARAHFSNKTSFFIFCQYHQHRCQQQQQQQEQTFTYRPQAWIALSQD